MSRLLPAGRSKSLGSAQNTPGSCALATGFAALAVRLGSGSTLALNELISPLMSNPVVPSVPSAEAGSPQ